MIYWYTGQPGHGKTLHALERAMEFKDAGRVVYACNVRALDHGKSGLLPMTPEQFRDWPDALPDGSVVLVDEAYEHDMLPKRGPGVKVPHHVEQLAKHRHRGLDFIFVCQSPAKQVDAFVHDLIEEHVHVRRRFGTSFVHLRIFDRYEPRPEKAHPLILKRKRLPKRPMGLYKSTELDTTEKRIPWYYYAAGVILVAVIAAATFVTLRLKRQLDPDRLTNVEATGRDGAPATARPVAFGARKDLGTASDYSQLHTPRFGTMPWTAKVYDDRAVTADPALYCLSSLAGEDGQGNHVEPSCTCLTEQGTAYELTQAECRVVARRGPAYNPYRTSEKQGGSREHAPSLDGDATHRAVPGVAVAPGRNSAKTFPENSGFACDTCETGPTP